MGCLKRNTPGNPCKCVGACTCPTACEVLDQETLELVGYIHGHELTISDMPSAFNLKNFDGSTFYTIFGLEALNRTFFIPPEPTVDASGLFYGCFGKRGTIATFPIRGVYPDDGDIVSCRGSERQGIAELGIEVTTQPDGVPKAAYTVGISRFLPGLGCQLCNPPVQRFIRVERFPEMSPRRVFYSTAAMAYRDYRQGEYIHLFNPCGNGAESTLQPVKFNLKPFIQATNRVSHIGWTYTVGGIPPSFFVRATNTTLAYEVIGLDIVNGDYERLIDNEEQCEIEGITFVEFDIQVREYEISTSNPCTSLPVGSAVDATARLFIPTTSADVVITIQLTPSLSKTILIRDGDTFTCDGIDTDGYVDEQLGECLSTPDPIVTLTSKPLLGVNE